jgi:hypothetical protein
VADPDGHYVSNIDGVDVRFLDGIHWTFQGDCWLAPRILPVIHEVAVDRLPLSARTTAALVSRAETSFPTSLCHAQN